MSNKKEVNMEAIKDSYGEPWISPDDAGIIQERIDKAIEEIKNSCGPECKTFFGYVSDAMVEMHEEYSSAYYDAENDQDSGDGDGDESDTIKFQSQIDYGNGV